jgi:hypothetical protein
MLSRLALKIKEWKQNGFDPYWCESCGCYSLKCKSCGSNACGGQTKGCSGCVEVRENAENLWNETEELVNARIRGEK